MDADIEGRIGDWPSRTVNDGYDGLRKLAEADFSGAVSLGPTWVFMVGGRVVGLRDGSMESIEGATGTAYQAPADALPLLFTMQTAAETEVRGQYYTEETPLSEVDATLEDAGFTGYIELSENVLSGDYYVVYHGGRSRSVAIVGTREEILQGKDAYDLADDEVGIYEVIQAPISVTEIPAPTGEPSSVGGAVGPAAPPEGTDAADENPGAEPEEALSDTAPSGSTATGTAAEAEEAPAESVAEEGQESGRPPAQDEASASIDEQVTDPDAEPGSDPEPGESPGAGESSPGPDAGGTSAGDDTGEPDSRERVSTKSTREDGSRNSTADSAVEATDNTLHARIQTLEKELENAHGRAEALAAERTELAHEVEALEDTLSEVEDERDELSEQVRELEAELAHVAEPAAEDRTDRPFQEAMQDTNLFVRYQTRSEPTLQDIQEGLDRERLRENLEIEMHTSFDSATVSIDGVPFEEALEASHEWAFVNWLVRDFPFEIRDTGQTEGLRGLVDGIPSIDRIDLQGGVASAGGDQETGAEVKFDVILRSKTGEPLVVADIHEGREPVGGESVDDLLDRTAQIIGTQGDLGAAFTISQSFFSPDALEAAQSATRSGFLSRDSRLSYVKTDRSQGYHLCLVEARDDAFHVTVPEL